MLQDSLCCCPCRWLIAVFCKMGSGMYYGFHVLQFPHLTHFCFCFSRFASAYFRRAVFFVVFVVQAADRSAALGLRRREQQQLEGAAPQVLPCTHAWQFAVHAPALPPACDKLDRYCYCYRNRASGSLLLSLLWWYRRIWPRPRKS